MKSPDAFAMQFVTSRNENGSVTWMLQSSINWNTYMVQMFDDVSGEPILLSHYNFYHLIEVVWTEIKDFYDPREHPANEKEN